MKSKDHGQETVKVSDHPVKFSGHRHSGREDVRFLVCHVILTQLCHQVQLD